MSDADGVDTVVPDATVMALPDYTNQARWEVFFSGIPDGATITGFTHKMAGITADPAPPGSY